MKNRINLVAPVPRATSRGMSLVELLVAIGIGALIVAAMALLFANNSRSRGETERAARKIENGRYGLEILRGELHHAGYPAELDPHGLAMPAAKPDPCVTDTRQLARSPRRPYPGLRQHGRHHLELPDRCEGRHRCGGDPPGQRLHGPEPGDGRCTASQPSPGVPGFVVRRPPGTRLGAT